MRWRGGGVKQIPWTSSGSTTGEPRAQGRLWKIMSWLHDLDCDKTPKHDDQGPELQCLLRVKEDIWKLSIDFFKMRKNNV